MKQSQPTVHPLLRKLDSVVGLVAVVGFGSLVFGRSRYAAAALSWLRWIDIAVLVVFLADAVVRLFVSPAKRRHLRGAWYDFIVLVPLFQFASGFEGAWMGVLLRQVVIVAMLLSRGRRASRFVGALYQRPALMMIASFAFAVLGGAVLLSLPIAAAGGESTALLDALFTSTSAVCVTGLIVVDTATHYSLFGQVVILILIQLGGLGIMTFSVFVAMLTGRRLQTRERAIMLDVLDQQELASATRLILFIVRMTVIAEAIGALILWAAWAGRFASPWQAGYHAVFHSISAFCNAGFSTFSDSLMGFSDDWATVSVIGILILVGGIGFAAVFDVAQVARLRVTGSNERPARLRVQTAMVLCISGALIVAGTAGFLAFEPLPAGGGARHAVLTAAFQSITARTAGFNTCAIGGLRDATLFLMMVLMFVGASPGSTGGGLKTSTFGVLWASMISGFARAGRVEIFRRTIPAETIQKALTILLFYVTLLVIFVLALLVTERGAFLDMAFEAVSAIATVGLSTGVTSSLSEAGRVLVTVLMFVGRLGPLTIAYALIYAGRTANYAYAEERVMIG